MNTSIKQANSCNALSYLFKRSQQYVGVSQMFCRKPKTVNVKSLQLLVHICPTVRWRHRHSPSPSSTTACTTMGKISLSMSNSSWGGIRGLTQWITRATDRQRDRQTERQTHLFVGPFAEVDSVWGQTELLANSPLKVNCLRLQGAVLGQVTTGNTHTHTDD